MHIGEKENWEKFTLWEESTRVPLLINFPNMNQKGIQCNEPVSLIDIYPTLSELAGFNPPKHCDGESLMPQLKNVYIQRKEPSLTSFKFSSGEIGHTLRSKNFRYIYYLSSNFEELYNHKIDPNEFENLAYQPKYKEKTKEFRKQLFERLGLNNSLNKNIFPPEEYTIYDGKIKKNGFKTIWKIKNDP
jgi:arylsulfatase A-like enzyme